MELERVGREAALATLRLTRSLIERHGPRIAGTRQCLNAADQVAEMLRVHCDRVVQERFKMHPGSFRNVGKIMAISYFLAMLFLIAGGIWSYLSFLTAFFGLVYGTVLYVFNGKIFDRWFAPAEGCNVYGVIEPSGEVRHQVILSGHHDSPYVLGFLLRFKKFARPRLAIAVVVYLSILVIAATAAVRESLGTGGLLPVGLTVVEGVLGIFFVVPLYFVITRLQSPGAGDNLNSTSTAITAGVHFSLRRKRGTCLKHTRVIILSTDGEEAGMRGAADYVKRHQDDLLSVPTSVFNMDSVYSLKELALITRDRNGTCALSQEMAEECRQIGAALGHIVSVKPLLPGSGGTDAWTFARLGVKATSFIGISAASIGDKTVYHTLQDTVEHIEPEAVEAALDIAVNYVMYKDQESQ